MKTEIYINGRFLTQEITGVQKFAWGVSNALHNLGYEIVFLCPRNLIHTPSFGKIQQFGNLKGHSWEQIELPICLIKNKISSFLNLCNTAPLISKNQFITIHDLAFERHPEWFNSKFANWYKWLIPKICHRAKHIFTVSNFSKKELIHLYYLNSNKITPVPNGIFWPKKEEEGIRLNLPESFILAVGSDNPRKNYNFLIQAFEKLNQTKFKLIIVGKPSGVFAEEKKAKNKNTIWLNGITNRQLINLYKKAHLAVSTSLYEGFGLPILEALSFGCPVLASDLEVNKELFTNYIHYYKMDNNKELTNKLQEILSQKKEIVDAEILNAKFNYHNSAAEIAKIINL